MCMILHLGIPWAHNDLSLERDHPDALAMFGDSMDRRYRRCGQGHLLAPILAPQVAQCLQISIVCTRLQDAKQAAA